MGVDSIEIDAPLRIPPGRHTLPPEEVARLQRERLLRAVIACSARNGYQSTTIADIVGFAEVSRTAFYEQFESKEECFLAAFEIVVFHLRELIEDEIEPIPDWPHRVVAGLRALLEFLAADPALARLCLVDSITAGPAVAERFREQIDVFVPLLQPGRGERDNPRPLPDSTEETLIGAMISMLSRSLAFGNSASLSELLPDFVEFVLMPYLGPTEAHRLAEESSEHS
jgi:AcrR family transcriptional regulator